jgi:hypothetical protein
MKWSNRKIKSLSWAPPCRYYATAELTLTTISLVVVKET